MRLTLNRIIKTISIELISSFETFLIHKIVKSNDTIIKTISLAGYQKSGKKYLKNWFIGSSGKLLNCKNEFIAH